MRAFIILGIVLLAVTFVIAKFALDNQTPGASAKTQTENESAKAPDRIVCWGYFEAEKGVRNLDPSQFGLIDKVEAENVTVEEGAVLLQVNDAIANWKVAQARAALKAAEQQFAEAQQLPEYYKQQKVQQSALIKSIELEIEEIKLDRDSQLRSLDEKSAQYKTAYQKFAKGLDKLAEKKKAEEAKLKQLELQDAKLKMSAAEADRDAKKAQLKEAEESLKLFQIVAPARGIILRANYKKGETIGPNPMKHAIEFLPEGDFVVRAEVLQEWGRYIKDPREHPNARQEVEIEDDTYKGDSWKGTVKSVSKWYAQARSQVIEPFRYNDVRTMEVIIAVKDSAGARVNQRVRAKVKIN